MQTKRILVAASLGDGRGTAFERGLALARASGAELYVLHAVASRYPFSSGAAERLARTRLLRRRAQEAAVTVRTIEQHGEPAEIIDLHANARRADLVVMGADDVGPRSWLRQRSIAERYLRRTTRPTLIVPADDDPRWGFENVRVVVGSRQRFRPLGSPALRLLRQSKSAVLVIPGTDVRHRGSASARGTLPRSAASNAQEGLIA